ncbi:MAG: SiaB family protein kinase [Candidatus Aminicenantes bacterium]|nr:SiaB family protein kinase [Candidatus Aminicenantes bacterium]
MPKLELLEYYKKMFERNIVLDFQGAISQDMLVGMAGLIRSKFAQESCHAKTVKRIFSTFVEMAQNIAHYSAERVKLKDRATDVGAGIIVVTEISGTYTITSGNLVEKESIPAIIEHCKKINAMDQDELKLFYKEQITSERAKGKKGGSIGLIDIARKSNHPIIYEATPVGEINSFLVLSVRIDEEMEIEDG